MDLRAVCLVRAIVDCWGLMRWKVVDEFAVVADEARMQVCDVEERKERQKWVGWDSYTWSWGNARLGADCRDQPRRGGKCTRFGGKIGAQF